MPHWITFEAGEILHSKEGEEARMLRCIVRSCRGKAEQMGLGASLRERRTVVVTVWRVVAGNTSWRGAGRLLIYSVVFCLAVCEVDKLCQSRWQR